MPPALRLTNLQPLFVQSERVPCSGIAIDSGRCPTSHQPRKGIRELFPGAMLFFFFKDWTAVVRVASHTFSSKQNYYVRCYAAPTTRVCRAAPHSTAEL